MIRVDKLTPAKDEIHNDWSVAKKVSEIVNLMWNPRAEFINFFAWVNVILTPINNTCYAFIRKIPLAQIYHLIFTLQAQIKHLAHNKNAIILINCIDCWIASKKWNYWFLPYGYCSLIQKTCRKLWTKITQINACFLF